MVGWWYEAKGARKGPVSAEQLGSLLGEGLLDANSLVWRDGMEQWERIGTLDEFQVPAEPPPLPPALALPAGLWWRFFARSFDIWLCQIAAVWLMANVMSRTVPRFDAWLETPQADAAFTLFCLPVALILDAVVHTLFGNTPGKALVGIRVTSQFGYPLDFFEYAKRNLGMWVKGLAFGLPIVILFTMWQQAARLKRGERTSYDEPRSLDVLASPVGWARKVAFSASFVALAFVILILNAVGEAHQRRAELDTAKQRGAVPRSPAGAGTSVWRNVHTGREALVPRGWLVTSTMNGSGDRTFTFSEPIKQIEIVFGFERADVSLPSYVERYRQLRRSVIHFPDEGEYFQAGEISAWSAQGAPMDKVQNNLEVVIGKFEHGFWRSVVVTGSGEQTDSATREFLDSLWNTVLR